MFVAFIEQLEIYVVEILFHLLDDELYCNNWPFDKLFNEISASPYNVDVKFKVVFIHFPLEYCKIWLLDGDEILKSLKNELFINVFSNKPTELL